jgi:hypothetical protein
MLHVSAEEFVVKLFKLRPLKTIAARRERELTEFSSCLHRADNRTVSKEVFEISMSVFVDSTSDDLQHTEVELSVVGNKGARGVEEIEKHTESCAGLDAH